MFCNHAIGSGRTGRLLQQACYRLHDCRSTLNLSAKIDGAALACELIVITSSVNKTQRCPRNQFAGMNTEPWPFIVCKASRCESIPSQYVNASASWFDIPSRGWKTSHTTKLKSLDVSKYIFRLPPAQVSAGPRFVEDRTSRVPNCPPWNHKPGFR